MKSRRLWACAVFALFLFRPGAIWLMRRRAEASDPAAWARLATNGSFKVLLPELMCSRWYDEANYAARVNQALVHGVPYYAYWADTRSLEHWLPECLLSWMMALPALLCGGDLNRGWLLAGALTGAGWFLLLHAVFLRFSGREGAALPLALFSVLFPDLYFWLLDVNLSPAVNAERWLGVFFQRDAVVLPYFRRLPSFYFAFLLTCLLWLGAWRVAADERRRTAASALLGLGFGLMVLVHSFEFAYGIASLGVFAAAALLGLGGLGSPGRRNLAVCLGAALAAVAAYLTVHRLIQDPARLAHLADIVGLVRTRRPTPMAAVHLVVAGAAWLWLRRETDPGLRAAWLFFASSQVAAFACRNAQVLVGFHIQPFHFIPIASFAGAAALLCRLARAWGRSPWWGRASAPGVARALAAFIAAWFLANEAVAAARSHRLFGLPKDIEAGYAWVRANLPRDALVSTPSMEVNTGLPIYTQAKVEVPPIPSPVLVYFSKEGEYLKRIARMLKTCRVDPDRFIGERWLDAGAHQRILDESFRRVNKLGEVFYESLEPAQWFYLYSYADHLNEAIVARGRARLREHFAAQAPLERGFWVWLNEGDRRLLSAQPESWGARLVYRNATVSIYER